MAKPHTILLLFCCFCLRTVAQDFQFAQYFATPLLLNPALTGYMAEQKTGKGIFSPEARVVLAHRTQYYRQVADYGGAAVVADWRRCIACVNCGISRSFWAIGLLVEGDGSQFAAFSQARAGLSGAYHLGLGRNAALSVGVSVAAFNFGFDASALRFDEQFDGSGHNAAFGRPDPLIGTDERRTQLDLNAGVNMTLPILGHPLTTGLALYHLKPVAYTLASKGNQLGLGLGFYATYERPRSTWRLLVRRQSFSGQQSKQHQLLLGPMIHIDGPLALGLMARANNDHRQAFHFDGLVPTFQLRSQQWQFLLSYDVPLSRTRRTTPGALELSAQFAFGNFGRCVYCPGL